MLYLGGRTGQLLWDPAGLPAAPPTTPEHQSSPQTQSFCLKQMSEPAQDCHRGQKANKLRYCSKHSMHLLQSPSCALSRFVTELLIRPQGQNVHRLGGRRDRAEIKLVEFKIFIHRDTQIHVHTDTHRNIHSHTDHRENQRQTETERDIPEQRDTCRNTHTHTKQK